jgi:hypothetical protein
MNDTMKPVEQSKHASASYVDELGADAAEAICASMVAANDDAPNFGPSFNPSFENGYDPNVLAHALSQLRTHAFSKNTFAPFFKGKFAQNYRVILGKTE